MMHLLVNVELQRSSSPRTRDVIKARFDDAPMAMLVGATADEVYRQLQNHLLSHDYGFEQFIKNCRRAGIVAREDNGQWFIRVGEPA